MNDEDRKAYRPAPKADEIRCPKCQRQMQVVKDTQGRTLHVCSCGSKAKRMKI